MTTDLWMLTWCAVLTLVIPNIYVSGYAPISGALAWGLGNRDTDFEMPAWVERAKRAHANLTENIGPFAILVLVAHASGQANATTALWSTVFVCSRVVHFSVYTLGLPYVRTLVFVVGLFAEIQILMELF